MKKMQLDMSCVKCQPFCSHLKVVIMRPGHKCPNVAKSIFEGIFMGKHFHFLSNSINQEEIWPYEDDGGNRVHFFFYF